MTGDMTSDQVSYDTRFTGTALPSGTTITWATHHRNVDSDPSSPAPDQTRATRIQTTELASSKQPDTVMMLHGFSGSGLTMAPLDQQLNQHPATLLVDLPHHGQTSVAPLPKPTEQPDLDAITLPDAVSALRQLLDTLVIERVDLIGYSLGGRTALSLAMAHPNRVRSLVLISASPGLADPTERDERVKADAALAQRIVSEGLDQFRDFWDGLALFAGTIDPADRLAPDLESMIDREQRRADTAELARSLRGMGTGRMPALHDRLFELDLPVLLLTGSLDTKYVALASEMVDALPQATHRTINGAAHRVHLDRPAATAAAIKDFWSILPDRSR